MTALEVVKQYYNNFNQRNWEGMLTLVHQDVRHHPNQGESRTGKEQLREFLHKMEEAYEEKLTDMVFYTEPTENRVAVEFVVNGQYKKGEAGMPEAHGQKYILPAGAFLEVSDGKISKITTYYNLPLWTKLVS